MILKDRRAVMENVDIEKSKKTSMERFDRLFANKDIEGTRKDIEVTRATAFFFQYFFVGCSKN